MAKIIRKSENVYTFNGDEYEISNVHQNINIFISSDLLKVLVTYNNLQIISEITLTQVDHYTPMLDIDNY